MNRSRPLAATSTIATGTGDQPAGPGTPVLALDHRPVPLRDGLTGLWRFRGVLVAL
ncbi:MAG: hypothetical protein QOK39_2413, partial [Acidimicrobiaceae bacterium]|nr:hypothetical protein [Acidimicrobiaceae bacterium]